RREISCRYDTYNEIARAYRLRSKMAVDRVRRVRSNRSQYAMEVYADGDPDATRRRRRIRTTLQQSRTTRLSGAGDALAGRLHPLDRRAQHHCAARGHET